MAGEITINGTLVVNNTTTGYVYRFQPGATTVTQTGLFACGAVQNIGTASEPLVVGDVATAGWFCCRNLSTNTNFSVELSPNASTSSVFGLLAAGEYCIIPLGVTAINARVQHTSATNTANIQYMFHNR